jgi:tripartite-type tricarboxylate transporter receptor subunit TctC
MFLKKGLIAGALVALAYTPAYAEWPERPVTITIAYGAGGTTDTVARAVGEAVSKVLGQPVVIENRPGAGGALATRALTDAKADGYNLVGTTSTSITLDPQLTDLGYGLDDFTYIAAVGQFPEAFVALPSKNWKTIDDALASSKDAGKLNYASTTTVDRMIATIVGRKAGVTMVPVPTKGGAEAVTQVMGGHVDMAYSSGAWYPQGKAGDLAVMAILGDQRLPEFPDAPTLEELGYGVASINLITFVAPKGLPDDVRQKLEAAFTEATKDKAVVDLMNQRGLNNYVKIGDDLAEAMKNHTESYKKMIQETTKK